MFCRQTVIHNTLNALNALKSSLKTVRMEGEGIYFRQRIRGGNIYTVINSLKILS